MGGSQRRPGRVAGPHGTAVGIRAVAGRRRRARHHRGVEDHGGAGATGRVGADGAVVAAMSDATRMTGGEAVAATLEALGVAHVFGIVSVHNIPIYDVIATRGAITTVSVRHEQAAVHAADGYARATGRLGVAIASTGPGTANAMGGLFEASFASSPVLLITGQVESRYYGQGRGFLHEAENQTDMLRSVTRRTESVRSTEEIPDALARVARDCLTGRRRPGAVEIPVDLQYRVAEVTIPDGLAAAALQPDEAALDEAAAV